MANGTLQLGQALGGQLQLSPSNQSRVQLAKQLLAGSMSGRPAVGGPIEALSRVGTAFFANKALEEQEQEQEQRRQQFARTLRNSLASGTGGQPGSASLGPPDPQQLSQALLTNPDTAPLGAQIGLSQALQGPQAQTQTISGEIANRMFGTNLAPGAAVTVESVPGGGASIKNVQKPSDADFTARNILLPSGDKVAGRTDNQGRIQVLNNEGRYVNAPSGAQIISTSLQGDEDAIGATAPEIRDFRETAAQLPVVKRLRGRIRESLESGDFVGGISGQLAKSLNSLQNQASQLRRQFNEGRPEEEQEASLDPSQYKDALGPVAEADSKLQSAILSLAYMTLKSRDPSGRVSDNDIKLELDSFGLDTSDPESIMRRVDEKIGDLFTTANAKAELLGLDQRFEFNPRELGRVEPVEFPSQQEAQNALERGDLNIGDEVIINGQRFKVQE